MDNLPYIVGQLNGYSFQTQAGGLRNDMAQPYSRNAYTQQSPTSQLAFSPVIDSRHDSLNSLSPSQPSGNPQHKAEFQPDATHLTPHFNTLSHRSEEMSRETSHASYQSSLSSGLRHDGTQEPQMYHQNMLSGSVDMRRALSLYSGAAALQNQLFRFQPGQYRGLNDHFHSLANTCPPAWSNMPQDSLSHAPIDDSVIDYQTNDAVDTGLLGFDVSIFGPG
jgi:hypothetical protein